MRKPLNAAERRRVERLLESEVRAHHPPSRPSKEGNLNHLLNGILACRFLSKQERVTFYRYIERFEHDYALTTVVDQLQVWYVVLLYLQILRAVTAHSFQVAERLDRDLRGHLYLLNATKSAREGRQPAKNIGTPETWAAELLAKMQARQATTTPPASDGVAV